MNGFVLEFLLAFQAKFYLLFKFIFQVTIFSYFKMKNLSIIFAPVSLCFNQTPIVILKPILSGIFQIKPTFVLKASLIAINFEILCPAFT